MLRALTSGTSVARCPAWPEASLRAWRVSRGILGTSGTSVGQVLRIGSIVGTEAGVFIGDPGLSLGHSRVDGVGYVSEHQPAGPL